MRSLLFTIFFFSFSSVAFASYVSPYPSDVITKSIFCAGSSGVCDSLVPPAVYLIDADLYSISVSGGDVEMSLQGCSDGSYPQFYIPQYGDQQHVAPPLPFGDVLTGGRWALHVPIYKKCTSADFTLTPSDYDITMNVRYLTYDPSLISTTTSTSSSSVATSTQVVDWRS